MPKTPEMRLQWWKRRCIFDTLIQFDLHLNKKTKIEKKQKTIGEIVLYGRIGLVFIYVHTCTITTIIIGLIMYERSPPY